MTGSWDVMGLWDYERFYQSTSGDFRQKKGWSKGNREDIQKHLSTKSLKVVSVSPSSSTQIHQTHVNLIMHSQSKDGGFEMISAKILAVVGCFWGLLVFDFSIT